jgi:DNA polymerase-3 subunit alpha
MQSPGTDAVVIFLKDVKAMKKLPPVCQVKAEESWLLNMRKKYGESNVKVVQRVLKNL